MKREDVFIANILKSRPPGNRDPLPDEIEACWPFLERQIDLIQPRVIATLGNFATKRITGSPTGITRCAGVPQVHELGGRTVFVFPLFHPAAGLRTPSVLERLRGDFAKLPDLLNESLPESETAADPDDPAADERRQPPDSQLGLFAG
jgi:DNA polymerase